MPVAAPKRAATFDVPETSYEADPHAWALEQANHLRAGAWSKLDSANLADEIEDVAGSERRRLTSAFRIILLHLLKWDHQPERRTRSWTTSIRTQRLAVLYQLEDCPSLAPQVPDLIERAYQRARIEASGETDFDETVFPEDLPYILDEIMTHPIPRPPAP